MPPTPSPSPSSAVPSGWWIQFFAIDLAQVFQIGFWIVAGVIAVLTYWQARRTIFQPLRVEVFKLQLIALTRISEDFVSRDEMALREYFDLANCVRFNADLMFESFARDVHQMRRETSLSEEFRKEFPGALISQEAMDNQVKLVRAPADESRTSQGGAGSTGRESASIDWDNYQHVLIATSREYRDAYDRVLAMARDPLVPAALASLLRELAATAHANLRAIGPALHEAAKRLRESYPNRESLQEVDMGWVNNYWTRRVEELEPVAQRIGEFTRSFVEAERAGFRFKP